MSIIKRTTAVQWLFEMMSHEVNLSERSKELFIQAQQIESEHIQDAYMANRRNLEEGEAETYYLTNYHA